MRIRTVKPEFWTHKMHRSIKPESALVALALLNYADDEGRFEADEVLFSAACFPLRPKLKVLDAWQELCSCGWLVLYESGKDLSGTPIRYGCIPGFDRHQVINRPSPSYIPPMNEDSVIIHGVFTDDSSGKGKEGKGKEGSVARWNEMLSKYRSIGVNVDLEKTKAEAWLLSPRGKGRKFTESFFANWLSRAASDYQKPITTQPPKPTQWPAL